MLLVWMSACFGYLQPQTMIEVPLTDHTPHPLPSKPFQCYTMLLSNLHLTPYFPLSALEVCTSPDALLALQISRSVCTKQHANTNKKLNRPSLLQIVLCWQIFLFTSCCFDRLWTSWLEVSVEMMFARWELKVWVQIIFRQNVTMICQGLNVMHFIYLPCNT